MHPLRIADTLMQLANRSFSPPWWGVILYLIVAMAMVALAFWQLARAREKIDLHKAAETARLAPAVSIGSVSNVIEASRLYRRVEVVGQFDAHRQLFWDNRSLAGRAGYEVITPVKLVTGGLALVNRGWIEPGARRDILPDVTIPAQWQGKVVKLEGFLSRPSKGFMSGLAVEQSAQWPKIMQYFDYNTIGRLMGEPIIEAVVQLQVKGAATSAPDAFLYKANWLPAASGPEKHYSYAFQWFAMAIALTVIFIVVNTRNSRHSNTLNNQ